MTGSVIVKREMLYTTFDGAKCCIFCGPDQDWHSPDCPLSAASAYEITEGDVEAIAEAMMGAPAWKVAGTISRSLELDAARRALTAFVRRLGGAADGKERS